MKKVLTVAQAQYQLDRARRAYERALQGFDDAAKERTADSVAKWEVEVRIARGQSETAAFNAVHRT